MLVAAPPASALAAAPTPVADPWAAELYDLLDATRAEHGLPALERQPALEDVAEGWSASMLASATLAHAPDLVAQLPAGWRSAAENVGVTWGGDAASLHAAWLASPGHRANVLDAGLDAVGIGVARGDDGQVWVTVDLTGS